MLVRLMQATAITTALYALVGLNTMPRQAANRPIAPPETLVAIKQVLIRHQ